MTAHPAEHLRAVKKHAPRLTSPDIKRFLDSLPVQAPKQKPVADMITEDRSDEDSPSVRILFAGLTWATVAAVLGAVAYLTWVMFTEI